MRLPVAIDKDRIADFCKRNHIRKLAFFGAVLREDFGDGSDVDITWQTLTEELPELIGQLQTILGKEG